MKRLTRSRFRNVATIVLLSAALIPIQIGKAASIIDLGTLPGETSSDARSINDAGQVVGGGSDPFFGPGFIWQNGVMSPLPVSGGGTAYAINNAGQVVGYSGGVNMGFLWQNGTTTYFDGSNYSGNGTTAYGINGFGQVVGSTGFELGSSFAVAFDSQTSATFLGVNQTVFSSEARAINDSGQVVGTVILNADFAHSRGMLWQNGTTIDLGFLPPANVVDLTVASDINNLGQVVGASGTVGQTHAFLWQNGVMTDLIGTPFVFNGPSSEANAINDAGQIVGTSNSHAVLWQNAAMIDLNDLLPQDSGWVLNEARDINNHNQIVGYGTIDGQTHGFLLTVPEPSTFALGVLGALSLAAFDRRLRRKRLVL